MSRELWSRVCPSCEGSGRTALNRRCAECLGIGRLKMDTHSPPHSNLETEQDREIDWLRTKERILKRGIERILRTATHQTAVKIAAKSLMEVDELCRGSQSESSSVTSMDRSARRSRRSQIRKGTARAK